jgi:hypothetical protein
MCLKVMYFGSKLGHVHPPGHNIASILVLVSPFQYQFGYWRLVHTSLLIYLLSVLDMAILSSLNSTLVLLSVALVLFFLCLKLYQVFLHSFSLQREPLMRGRTKMIITFQGRLHVALTCLNANHCQCHS